MPWCLATNGEALSPMLGMAVMSSAFIETQRIPEQGETQAALYPWYIFNEPLFVLPAAISRGFSQSTHIPSCRWLLWLADSAVTHLWWFSWLTDRDRVRHLLKIQPKCRGLTTKGILARIFFVLSTDRISDEPLASTRESMWAIINFGSHWRLYFKNPS